MLYIESPSFNVFSSFTKCCSRKFWHYTIPFIAISACWKVLAFSSLPFEIMNAFCNLPDILRWQRVYVLFCIYANAQICSRAVARSWVSAGSIIQIVIFAQQVHVKGGDPRFNFGWTSPSFVSVRWKKIHFEMCKLVPATWWLTRLTIVAVPLYTDSVPRQVPTIDGLHYPASSSRNTHLSQLDLVLLMILVTLAAM